MSATVQPWSEADLALLARLYPDTATKVLAQMMGRPLQNVFYKAFRLKLSKSTAYLDSMASGRMRAGAAIPRGLGTQFAPGQKPWNAGRKGWQAGGRSLDTQFSTGQMPPNTVPVGSYRLIKNKLRGDRLEQKTSEVPGANHKRWTPVSRLVWQAAHGPVPRGSIVVFKPGQVTAVLEDITLERLECITRAQHSTRNHPRSHSPELGRLVQLKGAIARQVNRISREYEAAQQQPQGQAA